MAIYDTSHKNAQCISAQGLLAIATAHKVASAAMCELIIKSYGLGCSSRLAKPREFMLSKTDPTGLFTAAVSHAEKLYGGTYAADTAAGSTVAKQALYLLCGRNSSNKVTPALQEWRNAAIDQMLATPVVKPAKKATTRKTTRAKKA